MLVSVSVWVLEVRSRLTSLPASAATYIQRSEVDPEVLDDQPVLDDLGRRRQLRHPLLDLRLERRIVPDTRTVTPAFSLVRRIVIYIFSLVQNNASITIFAWLCVPKISIIGYFVSCLGYSNNTGGDF